MPRPLALGRSVRSRLSAGRAAGGDTPSSPQRPVPIGRSQGAFLRLGVLNSAPLRGTGFLTGFSFPVEAAGGCWVPGHREGRCCANLSVSTEDLLSHVCSARCKLLLPLLLSEELEMRRSRPVCLLGCETCLGVRLLQAPGKVCWYPLVSEVILCPNTVALLAVPGSVLI